MTNASLIAAIRQHAPAMPIHLAIAIAANALGYGRAYDVPPQLIVAIVLHPVLPRVTDRPDVIPGAIQAIAAAEKARMSNGESTRGGAIKRLAERIRAAAESTTKET